MVLALLLTAGAGALGIATLAAAAHATDRVAAAGACGLNPCAPNIHVDGMDADGTVHVTYTAEGPVGGLDTSTLAASIAWKPLATPPSSAPQPTPPSAQMAQTSCTPGPTPITCDYSFPPELLVKKFLLNGTYQVTGQARACILAGVGCTDAPPTAQTFTVSNPPSAPTDVKAAVVPNSPTVKISWAPSPEPDITGYRVLRADGSFACKLATSPPPTDFSCVDAPPKDGSYAYHVVAYRWGPTYSEAITDQKASAPSVATPAVNVVGVVATAATTLAGGSGSLGPPGFVAKLAPNKPAIVGAGPALKTSPASPPTVALDAPPSVDPGFNATLPYGQQPPRAATPTDSAPLAAAATPHKGKASVATIALIGAGVLIGVIALHGLWLRSEVRRPDVLEVLEPEH